jgi:hypothetical protein
LRFVIHLLLMIAVALCVGFGLSYYALTDGRLFGAAQAGPWIAWPDVGSAAPNPYTRGHLARMGALQLGRSEGLQFVATTDSAGRPLSLDCTYRLDGHTPMATFWTLVALDGNGVNLARPGGQAAIRSTGIARTNDGSILLYVGKRLAPQNWLELSGEGNFTLVLTLYDTTIFSGISTADEAMPTITRQACP